MKLTHNILHSTSVNVTRKDGDTRYYYCDRFVDIVMTTVNRKLESEWHRHRRNLEVYFVLKGQLTLDVEDKSVLLDAGDMAEIFPKTWHRFKTTEAEVVFFAMKKIPLLKDKEVRSAEKA